MPNLTNEQLVHLRELATRYSNAKHDEYIERDFRQGFNSDVAVEIIDRILTETVKLAIPHAQKPFMHGIADPDDNAYFDECCVGDVGLMDALVTNLNDDLDEGDPRYSVVALYRDPVPDERNGRIAELEAKLAASEQKAKNYEQVAHGLAGEVDALKAQLAELGRQEPDYTRNSCGCCGYEKLADYSIDRCPRCNHDKIEVTPLFARPVPQAVSNQDYMCDSSYIAGLKAGYNLGVDENDTELNVCIDSYRKQMLNSKPQAVSQPYTVPDELLYVEKTQKAPGWGEDPAHKSYDYCSGYNAGHKAGRTHAVTAVPMATKERMREGFPSLSDYECVVAADIWNACRAAMLQSAPVKPLIPTELYQAIQANGVAEILNDARKYDFRLSADQWKTLVNNWYQTFLGLSEGFKESEASQTHAVPMATKQSMREMFPSLSDYECVVAADVWNACRAVMLQSVNGKGAE